MPNTSGTQSWNPYCYAAGLRVNNAYLEPPRSYRARPFYKDPNEPRGKWRDIRFKSVVGFKCQQRFRVSMIRNLDLKKTISFVYAHLGTVLETINKSTERKISSHARCGSLKHNNRARRIVVSVVERFYLLLRRQYMIMVEDLEAPP